MESACGNASTHNVKSTWHMCRMVTQRRNLLTLHTDELLRVLNCFDSLKKGHMYLHSNVFPRSYTHMHMLYFHLTVLFDCYGEVNRKMPDGKFCVQVHSVK